MAQLVRQRAAATVQDAADLSWSDGGPRLPDFAQHLLSWCHHLLRIVLAFLREELRDTGLSRALMGEGEGGGRERWGGQHAGEAACVTCPRECHSAGVWSGDPGSATR